MDAEQAHGLWVIALSLLLAFVLSIISMPGDLPAAFAYVRPDWVGLVIVYWVIAIPHRVGVIAAWTCGLLLDVLHGSLLGQHALALTLVAYIALSLYQRLRMFSVWQQSIVVFAIIGVGRCISVWVENIAGTGSWTWLAVLPCLVSALLWPWVFLALRFCRRRFAVN